MFDQGYLFCFSFSFNIPKIARAQDICHVVKSGRTMEFKELCSVGNRKSVTADKP